MFEHLKRLDQSREENEFNNDLINSSDAEVLDIKNFRQTSLRTVHEEDHDESGRVDTSEINNDDDVSDPVVNKPNDTGYK